ncbi:MAG: aminoacyl-tRNA hydrolase [Bacteroidales bacterium]|nr:aminoacyl-tRNA hydrolase [Bacteroidales bacterium]
MKYLIAGLGNIGDEYTNTRHNIGFIVADALAMEGKTSFTPDRYADVAKVKFKGRTLVVIKPSTYMNLSGNAIRYWLNKENIPIEKLLVVVDDLDLPTGTIRMKAKGGAGSHNGLTHITEVMGTQDFPRLRIGIGNDFARGYQVDYVLGKWTKEEENILIPKIKKAVEAIKSFVTIGIERTMNFHNTR